VPTFPALGKARKLTKIGFVFPALPSVFLALHSAKAALSSVALSK
jgi:hypothetical protein